MFYVVSCIYLTLFDVIGTTDYPVHRIPRTTFLLVPRLPSREGTLREKVRHLC